MQPLAEAHGDLEFQTLQCQIIYIHIYQKRWYLLSSDNILVRYLQFGYTWVYVHLIGVVWSMTPMWAFSDICWALGSVTKYDFQAPTMSHSTQKCSCHLTTHLIALMWQRTLDLRLADFLDTSHVVCLALGNDNIRDCIGRTISVVCSSLLAHWPWKTWQQVMVIWSGSVSQTRLHYIIPQLLSHHLQSVFSCLIWNTISLFFIKLITCSSSIRLCAEFRSA